MLLQFDDFVVETCLHRFCRVLCWLVTVEVLMIAFGMTTAPLLLAFVADIAVAMLLIRSCKEMRIALPASLRCKEPRFRRRRPGFCGH
jgi:hypothetical protein